MRGPVVFFRHAATFSDKCCADIRAAMRFGADDFISRARVAVGDYQQIAPQWNDGTTPSEVRKNIAELGQQSKRLGTDILDQLPRIGHFIKQAQFLQNQNALRLEQLAAELIQFGIACERATQFEQLNQGKGNVGDDARRLLIADCVLAYHIATGKIPSDSRNGTFAKVMRVILKAAGAEEGLSNDLLKSIITSGNSANEPLNIGRE